MDKVIRKYDSFDEVKADELPLLASRPAHERWYAVEEMIHMAYGFKGRKIEADVPRLQRPFIPHSMPMALGKKMVTGSTLQ